MQNITILAARTPPQILLTSCLGFSYCQSLRHSQGTLAWGDHLLSSLKHSCAFPPTLCLLTTTQVCSFGKSLPVHTEPRALDLSKGPQGKKVTPSWTPARSSPRTSQWWAGQVEGVTFIEVVQNKNDAGCIYLFTIAGLC